MKNILVIALLTLSVLNANAQTPIKEGINKASKFDFEAKSSSSGNLIIKKRNTIKTLSIQEERALTTLSDPRYTKGSSFLAVFQKTFSDARISEFLPGKGMGISLYFNSAGKITDMYFIISEKTPITAIELEKLQNAIANDITIVVPENEKTNGNYNPIAQVISFKKVLDRTLN